MSLKLIVAALTAEAALVVYGAWWLARWAMEQH